MNLRIASWNTNSINIRLQQIIHVMNDFNVDIMGVQETKVDDNNFPIDALHQAGFYVLFNGQKSYNGVAYISRRPLNKARHQLPGMNTDFQRRFLQAEVNDITLINCYVPNGKAIGDEKYDYKLKWLDALVAHLQQLTKEKKKIILMGDFNIAPDDRDVYDAELWKDKILCSPAEREKISRIQSLGFTDTFRLFNDEAGAFSWWDYRDGGFQKNNGHRIDLIFCSKNIKKYCQNSEIEKIPRGWERPSDHAPVIVTLTTN
ncbi:MAG: exodeoxyribonuclease III [Gammaproteobacteria bacterium]|nr:MAG: exodeoxyribonuclease III [Gammaproteobacteria bacterium]